MRHWTARVRQTEQGWGAKVIAQLSKDLSREFPNMKGFSPRNLKYMRAFAEAWPESEIVQEALAQITWYANLTLLEKVKDREERLFYIQQKSSGYARAPKGHAPPQRPLAEEIHA